jgi:hypothetical protein
MVVNGSRVATSDRSRALDHVVVVMFENRSFDIDGRRGPSASYVAAVRAAWTTTRASRPPRRARGGRAARPAPRVSEPRIASWTCSSTPLKPKCGGISYADS